MPIILHRTPYGKHNPDRENRAGYFARQGYVSVIVQLGRDFSKDHEYDAPDGCNTIESLAALPYTQPKVGMCGAS